MPFLPPTNSVKALKAISNDNNNIASEDIYGAVIMAHSHCESSLDEC